MSNNTDSIKTKLYPLVEKNMSSRMTDYKVCLQEFLSTRNRSIFSTMPLDRIYYGDDDIKKMFAAVGIEINEAKNAIANTYYGDKAGFNPRAAKDPVTVLMMCIIRYFFLKKDEKNTELSMIYLCFSGKFYPSVHYMSFPKVLPQDYVMEYVLNNMLNNKYILKTQKHLFGAMVATSKMWLASYERKFREFEDDDVVYLISQLHSRIRSFMINIAKAYYKAYENKDYMTYNSDNENPEEGDKYHLANSDSFKAEKSIQKTMSYIVSSGANYNICKLAVASNKTVKTEEIKSIFESILNDRNNIVLLRRAISILVYTYFAQAKEKDVVTMNFIAYSIQPKPNTKNPDIIELRNMVDTWLNQSSVLYRKRKHRLASKNDYNNAVLKYLALCVFNANK